MKTLLFYFLALAFITGCSKADNNYTSPIVVDPADTVPHPPVLPNIVIDSLPDTVGDSWTYQVNDTPYAFNSMGTPTQYNMTVTITGSIILPGGINANTWLYTYPGGTDTQYVFRKGDTVCFSPSQTISVYDMVKQYVLPLQLHHSWRYTPMSTQPVTIDSVADITVGPFTFKNSLRISGFAGRPDEWFNIREWAADKVGIVKKYLSTRNATNNPFQHTVTWALLSYHLQ